MNIKLKVYLLAVIILAVIINIKLYEESEAGPDPFLLCQQVGCLYVGTNYCCSFAFEDSEGGQYPPIVCNEPRVLWFE